MKHVFENSIPSVLISHRFSRWSKNQERSNDVHLKFILNRNRFSDLPVSQFECVATIEHKKHANEERPTVSFYFASMVRKIKVKWF